MESKITPYKQKVFFFELLLFHQVYKLSQNSNRVKSCRILAPLRLNRAKAK